MSAILVKPDGTVEEIAPENGKKFQLEELYKLLECETVEVIQIPIEKRIAIVDEDGRLTGKPANIRAMSILSIGLNTPTVIVVGNVIFCDKKQFL